MDLKIYLTPNTVRALVGSDKEFMAAISFSIYIEYVTVRRHVMSTVLLKRSIVEAIKQVI